MPWGYGGDVLSGDDRVGWSAMQALVCISDRARHPEATAERLERCLADEQEFEDRRGLPTSIVSPGVDGKQD